MQKTSALYQELLSGSHRKEVRLAIGDTGALITKQGEKITFGGLGILTGISGADAGYAESSLVSMKTTKRLFSEDTPSVGNCIDGEIEIVMLKPASTIPRQARLVPYVRLTDGIRRSEWIQKGVYFIDTRTSEKSNSGNNERLTIHGFDSMLKTEQDYPSSNLSWPAKDIDVVREIANLIDVDVDQRTLDIMTRGYLINYPSGYSCREVLRYIAAMYAGSFIMNDYGELRFVALNSIPAETRSLVDDFGNAITFGGVRIRV